MYRYVSSIPFYCPLYFRVNSHRKIWPSLFRSSFYIPTLYPITTTAPTLVYISETNYGKEKILEDLIQLLEQFDYRTFIFFTLDTNKAAIIALSIILGIIVIFTVAGVITWCIIRYKRRS